MAEHNARSVSDMTDDTRPPQRIQLRRTEHHPLTGRFLSGDCERDCQEACAYPGQFSECGDG
jgi:hypothetical protein